MTVPEPEDDGSCVGVGGGPCVDVGGGSCVNVGGADVGGGGEGRGGCSWRVARPPWAWALLNCVPHSHSVYERPSEAQLCRPSVSCVQEQARTLPAVQIWEDEQPTMVPSVIL